MIEWYTRDGGTVGFRVVAEQRSPAMTTNKPKTVWWVEPNHIPGVHKIRASVWYVSGRTVEVSHLVPQTQLDSAIVPRFLFCQIIFSMQSALNGVITGSTNNDSQ